MELLRRSHHAPPNRQCLVIVIATVSPYLVYQYQLTQHYCPIVSEPGTAWWRAVLAQSRGCPGNASLYSYVEERFWDVGFMKYYTPNHVRRGEMDRHDSIGDSCRGEGMRRWISIASVSPPH